MPATTTSSFDTSTPLTKILARNFPTRISHRQDGKVASRVSRTKRKGVWEDGAGGGAVSRANISLNLSPCPSKCAHAAPESALEYFMAEGKQRSRHITDKKQTRCF
ncbi:hypothetical protein AAMO2058_000395600 [Amorphochlora amoebiformis]|mmetsp:Transcript_31027/g.49790  ORF Transcript_31027/g.49790 Transcript_31027/m.49790 type:complete len:106 (-) Transcript_31027:243-560(-)